VLCTDLLEKITKIRVLACKSVVPEIRFSYTSHLTASNSMRYTWTPVEPRGEAGSGRLTEPRGEPGAANLLNSFLDALVGEDAIEEVPSVSFLPEWVAEFSSERDRTEKPDSIFRDASRYLSLSKIEINGEKHASAR